jgi:hypothetical protein
MGTERQAGSGDRAATQWAIFLKSQVLDAVQRAALFDDSKHFV